MSVGSNITVVAAGAILASGNLPDTPESPLSVTTLGGRPVRPRGRGFGRYRRRSDRL